MNVNDVVEFIIGIVGYFLIFMACDVNRPPEHKIKLFTWPWALQVLLVSVGVMVIGYSKGL
tara:strand:+ start:411 stop:593 length:183 start_codon:yes stop_codon:yes gene_type:complete